MIGMLRTLPRIVHPGDGAGRRAACVGAEIPEAGIAPGGPDLVHLVERAVRRGRGDGEKDRPPRRLRPRDEQPEQAEKTEMRDFIQARRSRDLGEARAGHRRQDEDQPGPDRDRAPALQPFHFAVEVGRGTWARPRGLSGSSYTTAGNRVAAFRFTRSITRWVT